MLCLPAPPRSLQIAEIQASVGSCPILWCRSTARRRLRCMVLKVQVLPWHKLGASLSKARDVGAPLASRDGPSSRARLSAASSSGANASLPTRHAHQLHQRRANHFQHVRLLAPIAGQRAIEQQHLQISRPRPRSCMHTMDPSTNEGAVACQRFTGPSNGETFKTDVGTIGTHARVAGCSTSCSKKTFFSDRTP